MRRSEEKEMYTYHDFTLIQHFLPWSSTEKQGMNFHHPHLPGMKPRQRRGGISPRSKGYWAESEVHTEKFYWLSGLC